jgi:dTDP-4-amino-4,6-dideoxygalactose transaminase
VSRPTAELASPSACRPARTRCWRRSWRSVCLWGDEVVTTAYSFFATAGVITRLGAIPRFVDIDPSTRNLDAGAVEAAVTPKTRAIVPVHLFGQCAEMEGVEKIAARYDITIVEDAAQAIGAESRDGAGPEASGISGVCRSTPRRTWARSATPAWC